VLVIVVAGVGGYIYFSQPDEIPNITLKASNGRTVDLDAMHSNQEELLLVFLLPQCPISKFSLNLVKQHYPSYSANVAFVGLLFGKQDQAEKFKSDQLIPFPVYGLRDTTDPYAVNKLIDTVGTSQGTRSAVYGGTIVVVNTDHKVLFKLEKDEIRQLPDKLADLGY
jgi:peroxiredoxin